MNISMVSPVESIGTKKMPLIEDVRTAFGGYRFHVRNPNEGENPVPSSIISVYKSSDGIVTHFETHAVRSFIEF